MFKKFVVYLLFFSFALQLIPVERVSAAAAPAIPPPAAHTFTFQYDQGGSQQPGAGVAQPGAQKETQIRYQFDSNPDDNIIFKSNQMSGMSFMKEDVGDFGGTGNFEPAGTPGSWDIYTPTDQRFQSSARPYLMVHGQRAMNLCFDQNTRLPGDTEFNTSQRYYPLGWTADGTDMSKYTFDCKFYNGQDTNPVVSLPKAFVVGDENSGGFATAWKAIPNAAVAIQDIWKTIKAQPSGASIAKAKALLPLGPNVQACQGYAATRLIATPADADKWLQNQLFQLDHVSSDTNDKGVAYLKGLLSNKAEYEKDLVAYDKEVYEQFYGDATVNPPTPYPTVQLTDIESGILTSRYQTAIDSLPFKFDPNNPQSTVLWGHNPAVISNWAIGIAAAALITAGGFALAGYNPAIFGTGAAAAGGDAAAAATATLPATTTSVAVYNEAEGTMALGNYIIKGPAARIMSEHMTAEAFTFAESAGGKVAGIITGGGLTVPLEVFAGEISTVGTSVGTALSTVGAGLNILATWAVKKTTTKVLLALGTALAFYKIWKQWDDDIKKVGTINPVVINQALHDYQDSGRAYFKKLTQFALLHYYLTANNNFNKCLQSKNDPAAAYNSAIQTKANAYLSDLLNSISAFNDAPGNTDGCPNLTWNPLSADSNNSLFGWVFCEINLTLFQIATAFAGFALKVAAYAIGVDST